MTNILQRSRASAGVFMEFVNAWSAVCARAGAGLPEARAQSRGALLLARAGTLQVCHAVHGQAR